MGMNEVEEAKSFLEVIAFLCGVCQSEKETVDLLTMHCIFYHLFIIIACILQTWKSEADAN